MKAHMTPSNDSTTRRTAAAQARFGSVTLFFSKGGQLPPLYITSSMSGWLLQEMSYAIDEGNDDGRFEFSYRFCNVPEGDHRYRFKLGLADVHYAVDHDADTELDEAGNLVNVISVKYGPSLQCHDLEQISDDDTSYRVVDRETLSVNVTGHDVVNLTRNNAPASLQRTTTVDVNEAAAAAAASYAQPDANIPCTTFRAESRVGVPQCCLSVEQHVKVVAGMKEKLSKRLSDLGVQDEEKSLLVTTGCRTDLEPLPLLSSSPSACRSSTVYWNASAALADNTNGEAVSAESDEAETAALLLLPLPQAQAHSKEDTKRRLGKESHGHTHARRHTDSINMFRLPGSPTVPWHPILYVALWLAVGAVFVAIVGAVVRPAFAAPHHEPL